MPNLLTKPINRPVVYRWWENVTESGFGVNIFFTDCLTLTPTG